MPDDGGPTTGAGLTGEVSLEAPRWTEAVGEDPDAWATYVLAAVAAETGAAGEIAILLTDDAAQAALNGDWRGKAGSTNVLSFPAAPNPFDHLGDVSLALETCAREAGEQGKTLADHVSHLLAHGVLHLLGHDHETDAGAAVMEACERAVLARIGIGDPYRDE
jgi:probable rRNA maturation factor